MKKSNTMLTLLSLLMSFVLFGQSNMTLDDDQWERLASSFEDFKYDKITDRRFKHADIMKRLDQLSDNFKVRTVGYSNENRSIQLVTVGSGPTNVLLWSQMHGNEPTATMALIDIFTWLEASGDEFDDVRKDILSKTTLHFIPMLNPDGAERFTRRNTQDIDINRDALRQQTPEGRILKRVRDSLDADWGFNLHDQRRATAAAKKPATLSFLAPAYDFEKSVNEKREDAMQLIAAMNAKLQQEIPGQIGRYSDDFEPRAFGDNIQKWGTRTILIESGGHYGDREKQEIRRLNYLSLLSAFQWIADKSYEQFTVSDYEAIVNNSSGLRDVILRNVQLSGEIGSHLTDIGIDFEEVEDETNTNIYLRAQIVDLGDLSTSGAYLIHDMKDLRVEQGRFFDRPFENLKALKRYGQLKLLSEGFTNVEVVNPDYFDRTVFLSLNKEDDKILLNANPSLIFYAGDTIKYALVNGYLIDVRQNEKEIVRGLKGL
jgi:hypothetical protein